MRTQQIRIFEFDYLEVYEIYEADDNTYNYYVKYPNSWLTYSFGVKDQFTEEEIRDLYACGHFNSTINNYEEKWVDFPTPSK